VAKRGVLVVSHGSRDEAWVRLVDETVAAARVPEGVAICGAFLELVEGRLIQDGIDRLEAQGVTDMLVVPLFVSSGSGHVDEIAWAFGARPAPAVPTDLEPFRVRARVRFGRPIGDDPDVAAVVRDKIRPLSVDPAREALLLVGHGQAAEPLDRLWRAELSALAERVRRLAGFATADFATMLPDRVGEAMERLARARPGCDVLVAPLFLSEGYFTRHALPERLAAYPHRYRSCALLPHPLMTRWLERTIEQGLEESA